MNRPVSKAGLSEAERRLVELLQTIDFGRIENLVIRGGQPVLQPPPQVILTRKMGHKSDPREEIGLANYFLKQPVIDLVQTVREVGDGEIMSITIMHGLPHVVEVQHDVRSA